jgi:hypothetical protein
VDLFDLPDSSSNQQLGKPSSERLAEYHRQLNDLIRHATSTSAFAHASTSTSGAQSGAPSSVASEQGDEVDIEDIRKEKNVALSSTRIGLLRKIIQHTPKAELDGLKEVLKGWRVTGLRITQQTATELIGWSRCGFANWRCEVIIADDQIDCAKTRGRTWLLRFFKTGLNVSTRTDQMSDYLHLLALVISANTQTAFTRSPSAP